jgi:hypothetical protein
MALPLANNVSAALAAADALPERCGVGVALQDELD